MIHDAAGCGQDEVPELTGWQQISGVRLEVVQLDVKARANHTTLVQTAGEVDNDFARSMIIDNLKLADVT